MDVIVTGLEVVIGLIECDRAVTETEAALRVVREPFVSRWNLLFLLDFNKCSISPSSSESWSFRRI